MRWALLAGVLFIAACGGSDNDANEPDAGATKTRSSELAQLATAQSTQPPKPTSPPTATATEALEPTATRLPRPTSTRTPRATPTRSADADIFDVGDKITYEDGFSVTVLTIEDPIVGRNGDAVSPRSGILLVGIEVEACAGQQVDDASINLLDFDLALDNNTRAELSYGLQREPVLNSATLFAGECLRGWVTFEKPWEPTLVYVVIDPTGYSTVRVKAR